MTMQRWPQRIHLSVPHMGGAEQALVREAFETNWLSTVGPHLGALEKEFSNLIGLPCVAVSSGTSALHLAVRLLGVGPGDEVVMPTLTFVACANAVRYEGGAPVFLDSERKTWGLDPQQLAHFLEERSQLGRLPKAVVLVHLFGQAADLDAIEEICARYDVPLIEDAANALGTRLRGRPVGTRGAVGAFSFGGNKIITATCGGMLVARKAEWVERARLWATQARAPDPEGVHNYVHHELGYNYRLSNLLAGVARGQLRVLEERIAQRRAVFERYQRAFADVPALMPQPEWPENCSDSRHTRWLSCFLLRPEATAVTMPDLVRRLESANIEARPVWKPMHWQPLHQARTHTKAPVAEDLHRRGFCLPSSSSLTQGEQSFVIEQVRAALLEH